MDLIERDIASTENPQELLVRLLSPEFWNELASGLTIAGATGAEISIQPAAAALAGSVHDFREQGWLQAKVLEPSKVSQLDSLLRRLRQRGIPPIYLMMYDVCWEIARLPHLSSLISNALNDEIHLRPFFWVHDLDDPSFQRGWRPHIDDGLEKSTGRDAHMLSLWVPLRESSAETGCMYLVPENRQPDWLSEYGARETYTKDELNELLHAVRAVPARPGDVLGWHNSILHWGSQAEWGRATPRASLAFEYQRKSFSRKNRSIPALEMQGRLPSFEERLLWISRQILTYGPMFEKEKTAGVYLQLSAMLAQM